MQTIREQVVIRSGPRPPPVDSELMVLQAILAKVQQRHSLEVRQVRDVPRYRNRKPARVFQSLDNYTAELSKTLSKEMYSSKDRLKFSEADTDR